MSRLLELARPEIRELRPYAYATWDPALVRLHANENPWADETDHTEWLINRYPEPQPRALGAALAAYYGVGPDRVLACRGSDEGIDLLIRAFCRAGCDRVMTCPPTFAMYGFAAAVQGAEVVEVPLDAGFDLDADAVLGAWSPAIKIVFLCSPNNPSGNRLDERAIERVIAALSGRALVVVDEAYVELAGAPSCLPLQSRYSELVVLRTLSKAHGLAGARCGAVLAVPAVIDLLARIIPPYALSAPSIMAALAALAPRPPRANGQARGGDHRRARASARGALAAATSSPHLAERDELPAGGVPGRRARIRERRTCQSPAARRFVAASARGVPAHHRRPAGR